MIRTENVCAGYGAGKVLQDVTADFPTGQITVIVGPNGSGKSTLLKTIAGILPAESGRILYDGREKAALQGKLARQVAYMPQTRPAPAVTAGRMVLHGRFPYLTYPKYYSERDRELAEAAMVKAGCLQLRHRQVSELSGGERQSVYFAMAYVQDTPAVLMDEPTAFLDVPHQLQLMKQSRMMAEEGKTVALVLHDLPMAMKHADRMLLLADGKVQAQGLPEDLRMSGALEDVFGIRIGRLELDRGVQYYCEV